MGSYSTNSQTLLILSCATTTYWKSISAHLKNFLYEVLQTLHKEISIAGEAGKNNNLGTETLYELEERLSEMYTIFKIPRKVQFQKIASCKTAY